MSSLYDYTNSVAVNRPGSNRGLAAETAASLLAMGIELMEKRNKNGDVEDFEFTEEEVEAVRSMALSAEEHQKSKEQFHFMDKLIERMVRHSMSEGSEGAEELSERLNDPSRSKKPPLSIRILTSNLKRLSSNMGAFFKFQYGVIHIITWQKPTKTLCALMFYTAICLWPHLVVAMPLLVLLFGIILPSYLHRHPMDTPELIKVQKRGQSFLAFLTESNDNSVVMDILDVPEEDSLVQTQSTSSGSYAAQKPQSASSIALLKLDVADDIDKKNNGKFVKKQVSLLMNMRDLQNLTTELLNSLDQAQKIMTDLVGFKDERLTTFIFYITIVVTSVVFFLGKYIPWRMIFIQSGWAFMILCHPNTKKYLVTLSNNKKSNKPAIEVAEGVEGPADKIKLPFESFDRHDIIVDDQPEVRIVEIYELQRRDLFKHEWKLYAYTKRLFDFKDTVRVSGKLPHGVDALSKVLPPPEWKYDFGFANNWRIDQKPLDFLHSRGINQTHLVCSEDEDGWIYDDLPVDQDSTTEFRRRRLYRECYRYARPPPVITL